MLIVVDTNMLLRLVEPNHAQHELAAEAIGAVRKFGHGPVLVPQIVYEFWSVATRPLDVNGLGMSTTEVYAKLDEVLLSFKLLLDERAIFELWQKLVLDHQVKGKQVHDARLVAAMLRHGISHLLTFNAADFSRYTAITVIEPRQVSSLAPAN